MTSSVKALLKQNCTPVYRPLESIKIINDVLIKILPEDKFLTACYACLNRKTKSMTIISAGHPPIVYAAVKGKPKFISLKGDVLGSFSDVAFGQKQLKVTTGDRLYIYSDGLIESTKKRRIPDDNELLEACKAVAKTPVRNAPEEIVKIMGKDTSVCEDDIIVLAIEV